MMDERPLPDASDAVSDEAPDDAPVQVSVPLPGGQRSVAILAGVMAAVTGVLGFLAEQQSGLVSGLAILGVGLLLAVLIAGAALQDRKTFPTALLVDRSGVRVTNGLGTRFAPWASIRPSDNAPFRGRYTFLVHHEGKGIDEMVTVSVEAALAVFRYPGRPRWTLPPEVWKGLGLEPD